jgi:truncated hemoglobin YjbI
MDNGGSDPISPDFWDGEEEFDQDLEDAGLERQLQARLRQSAAGPSNYQTPQRPRAPLRQRERIVEEGIEEEDEDQWAAEAARAEEAERQREAEEAELAERVEASHRMQNNDNHYQDTSIEIDDIDMDWDVDMNF